MQPVAGSQVETVWTRGLPDDTTRQSGDGVTADVSRSWSNANETMEVVYRARLPSKFSLAATATWQGEAVPASAAWDQSASTSSAAAKPTTGNALGRPLLDRRRLDVAGGMASTVQIVFARAGDHRPAIGDQVAIAVPMPHGARIVRFRVAAEKSDRFIA
ncbi:hypothetical protein ACH0BU_16990 [Sphingomonas olei]